MGPVGAGGGKRQPGLKELRDEVRASRTAGQTADRQSLGSVPRGWGSGRQEEGGGRQRLLGRGIPEHLGFLNLTTGQFVKKGRQRTRGCWGRDSGGRGEAILPFRAWELAER